MPRFYVHGALRGGSSCLLPEEAAHHAIHVLRIRAGDPVVLFNGQGGEYPSRVASIERLKVMVDVLSHDPVERESPLRVTLVQGVSAGEKMDFTIRKAVELGAAEIQPVLAAASVARPKGERAASRHAHWQRIAISACEQCGRNRIPAIEPVMPLAAWIASRRCLQDVAVLDPRASQPLADVAGRMRGVLIGPEGGLTGEEVALATSAGAVAVNLGARTLRADTAAIAALGVVVSRTG